MLVFTITMLMAGLAAFGATLTLPGIAGIVLTSACPWTQRAYF